MRECPQCGGKPLIVMAGACADCGQLVGAPHAQPTGKGFNAGWSYMQQQMDNPQPTARPTQPPRTRAPSSFRAGVAKTWGGVKAKVEHYGQELEESRERDAPFSTPRAATTCKKCGYTLLMTLGGRCRFCKGRVGMFRAMRGTTTVTRAGARRVLQRRVEKQTKAQVASGYMPPPLSGMTWQQAEQFTCKWMVKNGYRDAVVTASGPDGGVDIRARKALGQVKHHQRPVGIAEVQRLFGIARAEGKKALLFSASGVTKEALRWANSHDVGCFSYPPVRRL